MQQYLDLLKAIKERGTYKDPARENMPGTTSLFGYQFRHNLQDGFPILTTKRIHWKSVVVELLWFLRGDTNIKYLVDNGVNIWNEDAYNYYCKKCKEQNIEIPYSFYRYWFEKVKGVNNGLPIEGFDFEQVKPKGYEWGDCGYQYGRVWRAWDGESYLNRGLGFMATPKLDQIANLITSLKKNPSSRRHIVTAIDPAHEEELALYWCHAMFQLNCRPIDNVARAHYAVDNNILHRNELMFDIVENPERTLEEQLDEANIPKYYLDCQLYQRSADVFLGVPFNIASYALLTHIIAKICNMIPGEFIHTFGDVHIYDNHKEAVEEQLSRDPLTLPKVEIWGRDERGYLPDNYDKFLTGRYTLNDFILSFSPYDFKLKDYSHLSPIKAELSTGLVK